MSGQCVSSPGTLSYSLERYVLDCPASQQHRNKVAAQADAIRSTIRTDQESSLLVIACGGCPDIRFALNDFRFFRGQLWLNDIDEGALDYSTGLIASVCPQVRAVRGNVIDLLKGGKSLPRFDLIVAGGLFDYLDDRVAKFVIKNAFSRLSNNGRFFFTNIGANPIQAMDGVLRRVVPARKGCCHSTSSFNRGRRSRERRPDLYRCYGIGEPGRAYKSVVWALPARRERLKVDLFLCSEGPATRSGDCSRRCH